MNTYQDRVKAELFDLQEKITKLTEFQKTSICQNLELVDQNLLQEQKMAMIDYADILKLRLARFKE